MRAGRLCTFALSVILGLQGNSVHADAGYDHYAVAELASRYAWATDTLERSDFEAVFAADATVHYQSVGSDAIDLDERLEGIDAIHAWLVKNLAHRERRVPWRFVSNQVVDIDGNSATVRAYMHNRVMSAGGVYYIDAVKSDSGWRIKHLKLEEQTWNKDYYRQRNAGKPADGPQ
jgi:hypothetical protein